MFSSPISRRNAVALSGSALSALALGGSPAAAAQPPRGAQAQKPDKQVPPRVGGGDKSAHSPAVGKPVSQTAAVQEGEPKVPGPPEEKLRFALVGLGKLMVEEILPALRLSTRCDIAALVTGDRDKGNAIAEFVGLPRDRVFGYQDIPRFKDDASIEAVYIATPNSIHARDAIAALNAGKHVLCEKPMTTTVADADAMIAAAKANDRKLMVAYRVHHEPLNNAVRTMLKEKRYGKPHFVTFDACMDVGGSPQPRLSRQLNGGGSLFDIGIYALNTTCWLLGETPIEISAMERTSGDDKRFKEIEQSIAFHLRFPSGCIATCTSSFGTARVNRYRIVCEKGWMGMDPATHYRGIRGEYGDDTQAIQLNKPESVNQFTAEFEHLAKCIRENKPVESPGDEGRRDVELMHQIYEAAAAGKSIKLSS